MWKTLFCAVMVLRLASGEIKSGTEDVSSGMQCWRMVASTIAYYGIRNRDSRGEDAETTSELC